MHMADRNSMVIGKFTVCFSQVLGKGATGIVYKGYHNMDRTPAAIKVIQLSTIKDDATKSLLDNEKSALKIVQNPNIIKLLDIVETNQCCYIITELCEGQTLKEYIAQKGILSEEQAMNIFRKILQGCLHITQNCIIHRDLKPANILLNSDLQPKIIDFGFSEIITAKKMMRTFNVGSPSYMSPEAYLRTLYSQKSDSWSLGVILFEMLHGKTPEDKNTIRDYFESIKNNPLYLSFLTNRNLDKNVKEILQKSLKYLPQERMSISGMKYLADVYNIKVGKTRENSKALNYKSHFGVTSIKNLHSLKEDLNFSKDILSLHKIQPQTINSISNDSSSDERHGFITFSDFSKNSNSFSNRYNQTSQISVVNRQNKHSSITYSKGYQPNQNNELMANKYKPSSYVPMINNYQHFNAYQSNNGFSGFPTSKEIIEKKMGLPAFRQITVRYL